MSDGFLSRWSKRKLDAEQGRPVEAEPPQVVEAAQVPDVAPVEAAPTAPPPPTLEDAHALTPQSDFKRFVGADVTPDVKNAAMKKLFSDPRYNVMDGLDVYTGDYSQPDPIPESMLRQLASAKFLGLFDQEEKEEAEAAARARDVADNPDPQTMAQSVEAPPAVPEPTQHADLDLRLQQDHAAPGEDPGHGTG